MKTGAVYQKIKDGVIKVIPTKQHLFTIACFLWLHFSKISYLHPFAFGKMTHATVHSHS